MMNTICLVGRIISLPQSDYLDITLSSTLLSNSQSYLKNGDLVGIKGHMETNNRIICDKLTFLSKKERGKLI